MTDSLKERLEAKAAYIDRTYDNSSISDLFREAAQAISTLEAERQAQDRELARVENSALDLMAEKDAKIAGLEAERDRLREAAQFVTDAVTTLRQFKREYPMDIDSQSCAEEAIWLALASLAAALNPSTGVGGGGS